VGSPAPRPRTPRAPRLWGTLECCAGPYVCVPGGSPKVLSWRPWRLTLCSSLWLLLFTILLSVRPCTLLAANATPWRPSGADVARLSRSCNHAAHQRSVAHVAPDQDGCGRHRWAAPCGRSPGGTARPHGGGGPHGARPGGWWWRSWCDVDAGASAPPVNAILALRQAAWEARARCCAQAQLDPPPPGAAGAAQEPPGARSVPRSRMTRRLRPPAAGRVRNPRCVHMPATQRTTAGAPVPLQPGLNRCGHAARSESTYCQRDGAPSCCATRMATPIDTVS
jgi:hypothetical protein